MKNQVVTKKVNDWLSIYQNTEDEFCNATALLRKITFGEYQDITHIGNSLSGHNQDVERIFETI